MPPLIRNHNFKNRITGEQDEKTARFLLFAGLFSLQSIHALARDEWMEIAKKFIPPNTVLADPESIELYDFDQDGRNQIVATFQLQAGEPPSRSKFGAIALKKQRQAGKKYGRPK